MKIRFQKDMRPLVKVTIGKGWAQKDYGVAFTRFWSKPSLETFPTGTWYADFGPVMLWCHAFAMPQTVGERGTW